MDLPRAITRMVNVFLGFVVSATVVEGLVVMMPDIFDLLVDAIQVPLKHPPDEDHHQERGDEGDEGRIFNGAMEAHSGFFAGSKGCIRDLSPPNIRG